MAKRIYIFRHGMTEAVKRNRPYGKHILDAQILPESIPVIERMAKYLQTIPGSLNFSSEVLRCRQTVEIVNKVSGKKFTFDPRINEYGATHWETPMAFMKRIRSFFAEIESSTVEDIIICTHAAGISALIKLIRNSGWPWWLIRSANPGVLIIGEDREIKMINFANDPTQEIPLPDATNVLSRRRN